MTVITETNQAVINAALDYLFRHKTYMLAGKDRLLKLPEHLRGYASFATEEFFAQFSHPTTKRRSEVLLFTTENDIIRALHGLRQPGECFEDYELSSVSGPPVLLLKHSVELEPEKIIFNIGSEHVSEVPKDDFSLVSDCIFLCKVAQAPSIFIVEDVQGVALEMELEEGKRYAFGFLEKEDATATLDGLSVESPGCRLRKNDLLPVVRGVLQSELQGLLLNPASSYQMTFHRDQLELLGYAAEKYRDETKLSVGNFMKNLFAKPKR